MSHHSIPMPARIHIIGRKNHGKTTLVCDLAAWLTNHGHRVGTIKHTHHQHELDLPGKDSHRHRQAGGNPAAILSRTMSAVFWDVDPDDVERDRYSAFAPVFADCELVLVEGDQSTDAPKVEVWRHEVAPEPLAASDPSIAYVITDDPLPCEARRIPRSDIEAVARAVLELGGLKDRSE